MRRNLPACISLAIAFATTSFAGNVATSLDAGGRRVGSASFTMDCSIGGIGGISSVASPGETLKGGYVGELSEVVSVSVTGTPAQVNEGNTSQLSGLARMDDDTVTALAGGDISWSSPSYPLAFISGGGLAASGNVYANAIGLISGSYLGVNGSGQLLVLDSNPDNYGSYASDGLPDNWQVQYFGLNNPNAAPGADADGTGQNNLFKYVAGLDPTNRASVFVLKIAGVTGQPGQKQLIFSPRWTDRTYAAEYRTNLVSGTYGNLTGTSTSDNGTERTVTDLSATEKSKFYRVKITYP